MNDKHNAGFSLEAMLEQMPHGLDRAVLRVISYHAGRPRAISRGELLIAVRRLGFDVDERVLRAQINNLRKDGHLILSTGGVGGGYWLAANRDEYEEFKNREYLARIKDLGEQVAAMDRGAQERFGKESPQIKLF
jgi:hypothetical protein